MTLYVLDQSFTITGVIDNYISLIWRPAYYSVGDFELYVNATTEAISLLKKDHYLVRDKDVSIDPDGKVTYRSVMIIKNFTLSTDLDEGDHYSVSGREIKYLLHQRIVRSQTNLYNVTPEAGIRSLVTANAISPTLTRRAIPNLVLGAESGLSGVLRKQITGDFLDVAIESICETYGYGWDMFIQDSKIVFIVYSGVDRSYNQTARPFVVFSDQFDNLINSEYELNSESYANCAMVAGEGEGIDRSIIYVNDANVSGLDRYELYVDARDLSSTGLPAGYTYEFLLMERGKEKLSEVAITEGFSGEVINATFIYGSDYGLGDKVTVVNKYGIAKDVMVLSVIESEDINGSYIIPQFNI